MTDNRLHGCQTIAMHSLPKKSIALTVMLLCLALSGAGPATQRALRSINLGQGFMIDIPADWTRAPQALLSSAFAARSGSALSDVFHLQGSRPTDLPYATIEQLGYTGMVNPTLTQQQQLADQVATFYETAFNPPSKADRPPLFKSAKVTPVVFDPINRRFTFSVVVKYDMIGDQVIEVSGCFGKSMFVVSSIWMDSEYFYAHKTGILAMRDSIRLGTPPPSANVPGLILKRAAQFGVFLVVLLIAAIQAFVLWKERRERRAEEARLLS